MKKSELKQLIKECLNEMVLPGDSHEFPIGARVEFTMTGTVKENRLSNHLLSLELDNDEIINVHTIDNKVKKLEF